MSESVTVWTRSTYCADQACVEVTMLDGEVLMRDGKRPDDSFLRFAKSDWHAFLDAIRASRPTPQ